MSCCGESRVPENGQPQLQSEPTPYLVNHQPSPHPGPQFQEKGFVPPNINTPPPAQQFNGHPNGFQLAQQQWAGNNPRAGSQVDMSQSFHSPSGSRTYTPLLDPNVVRPDPVHAISRSHTTSPPMVVPSPIFTSSPMTRSPNSQAQPFAPPSDEGRISVSIDFGVFSRSLWPVFCSFVLQAQRSLVWCVSSRRMLIACSH